MPKMPKSLQGVNSMTKKKPEAEKPLAKKGELLLTRSKSHQGTSPDI